MTFGDLLKVLRHRAVISPGVSGAGVASDTNVLLITEDSRRVTPGSVFVAARGERDGHDFVSQAAARGAIAVLGERAGTETLEGLPYIGVTHARKALGIAAHALAGDPSRAMTVVGVTGTNGKSSTVSILTQLLERFGQRPAEFGTLGYRIGGALRDAKHTTPFGEELAELFRDARAAGHTHVIMEVCSHALEQERVAGIEFDIGIFTNLTQDHLDYHGDMDAYRAEKLRLFERVAGPDAFTVTNIEDPSGAAFKAASGVPCYTYGDGGDCRAERIRQDADGTRFEFESPWGAASVESRLMGRHNVMNMLAAMTACGGLGLPVDQIAERAKAVRAVPGRFERIDAGQNFHVVVDYAHTDDGLRNVLRACREICAGRLIAVFGCGGDRDRGKRPLMARAVAELADFGIITSDNPRTEDPARILDDTEAGMRDAGKQRDAHYGVVADRADAIGAAIAMAAAGDVVLIAGKGHEDYQILGTERIHFDDREVARAHLTHSLDAACEGGR